MAQLGTVVTVGGVGPSGVPDAGEQNLFIVLQSPWGIPNVSTPVTSYSEFIRLFGADNKVTIGSPDVWTKETDTDVIAGNEAVKGYFAEKENGSPGVAYVVRVIDTTTGPTAASRTFSDGGANNTTVTSKWPGSPGGTVTVAITNPSPARGSGYAQMVIEFPFLSISETWEIATAADAADASFKSQLVTITLPGGGQLPATAAAAKLDGGTPATAETYDATTTDLVGTETGAGVKTGLSCFNNQELGSGYVCCPGKFDATIRTGLKTHAEAYNRHALYGTTSGLTLTTVASDKSGLTSTYGQASYWWPNVKVDNPAVPGGLLTVDPVGHVAGLAARMQKLYGGPHKSPAGINHAFNSVRDVERQSSGAEVVTDAGSETLADSFINTLRVKNGRIVSYGLRTLATDNRFRQFQVATTVNQMVVKAMILMDSYFAEPIDEKTFSRIKGDLDVLCADYYTRGALFGDRPGATPRANDAWLVVCDRGNNSNTSIDAGAINVDMAIVCKKNAERINLNIYASATGSAATIS